MNSLVKMIIGVVILVGVIFVGIILYGKYTGMGNVAPSPTPIGGQLPGAVTTAEEKKIKELAENFVRGYGTYQFGNFTNIESLKDQMTARLWQEKEEWISAQKEEIEKQPKKYITYSVFTKKVFVLSQTSNESEVEVGYLQRELKGAIIQGPVTIEWIDENGQKNSNIKPTDTEKKATLKFIRENSGWKVDDIRIRDK